MNSCVLYFRPQTESFCCCCCVVMPRVISPLSTGPFPCCRCWRPKVYWRTLACRYHHPPTRPCRLTAILRRDATWGCVARTRWARPSWRLNWTSAIPATCPPAPRWTICSQGTIILLTILLVGFLSRNNTMSSFKFCFCIKKYPDLEHRKLFICKMFFPSKRSSSVPWD